jgi:hypothetical protein
MIPRDIEKDLQTKGCRLLNISIKQFDVKRQEREQTEYVIDVRLSFEE